MASPSVGGNSLARAPPAPAAPKSSLVARVEALVAQGNPVEAVLLAYRTAEDDVRRAFGMNLPPQWTHREFLRRHLRADMGYVAVLLPQLYAIYEPVRYGDQRDVPVTHLVNVVRSLYQEPVLRNALSALTPVSPPGKKDRFGAGAVGSDSGTIVLRPGRT
jgi:hypothetical protein